MSLSSIPSSRTQVALNDTSRSESKLSRSSSGSTSNGSPLSSRGDAAGSSAAPNADRRIDLSEITGHSANGIYGAGLASGALTQTLETLAGKLRSSADELIALKNPLNDDLQFAIGLRNKLAHVVSESGVSYAADKLSVGQRAHIKKLDQYIESGTAALVFMEQIPPELLDKSKATQSSWLKGKLHQVASRKTLALAEAVLAMALKNGAWYLPRLMVPSKNVDFSDIAGMSKLILARSAIGTVAAAVLEYPFATHSQKAYVEEKGMVNNWAAFAQAADNITAGATLYGIGKATKEPLSGFDLAGFGGSAIAATIQSGSLENLLSRKKKIEGTPAAASSSQAQGPAAQGNELIDLEAGEPALPNAVQARSEAKELQNLPESISAHKIESMQQDLVKAYQQIGDMNTLMSELNPTAATSENKLSPEGRLQSLGGNIDTVHNELKKLVSKFKDISPEAMQGINETLNALAQSKNELSRAGGPEPHAKAFFATTALMFAVGLIAGNVGPAIKSEFLSNINNRAVILAVTSSIAQAFANLGQFLGGAHADDSALVKFMKVGEDHADDSRVKKALKGWGRAVRFLPFEFIPLQMANTFAEKALHHAGNVPDAVSSIFPSVGNIRNWQEAARAVMTLAFTMSVLGDNPSKVQTAGVAVNALSALGMCLWQAKTAGKLG